MSYSALERIEKLVHYVWDAVALACLENADLRYSRLRSDMKARRPGRRLTDTDLTRCLRRLLDDGMIRVEPGTKGYNVYIITEAGQDRLDLINELARIAPRL